MLLPYLHKKTIEAGLDEAGRGCLSGPVFAACVVLPKGFKNKILDDSKKLTEKKRDALRTLIEQETIWAVATASPQEIDDINILNASILAMHRAIDLIQQKIKPEFLLIDGNRFKKYQDLPHQTVIKGDGKYMSIAAASILAKTHRDEYMTQLHEQYPMYDWKKNKGYPTLFHREALIQYGHSEHHRLTFMPVSNQLKLI